MKLNYKRTLLVGFAFFLICTFWQAYDTVIPKILTDRFGMSQAWSGIIMALDNILALFMLPLFGTLSDKSKSKLGKRTPFILFGTIAAVTAFMLLTVADIAQLKKIEGVTAIDDPTNLTLIYDSVAGEDVLTPDGAKIKLNERYTRDEFSSIKSQISETAVKANKIFATRYDGGGSLTIESKYKVRIVTYDGTEFWIRDRETEVDTRINELITVDGTDVSLSALYEGTATYTGITAFKVKTNSVYTNYVVPARQQYIGNITKSDPSALIWFMIILMVVLVSMSTFRSPAVALMPDVTIKPLRSKANAVINLMGTVGGMSVLVLGMGFAFANSAIKNTFRPWLGFFGVVAGIMLFALAIFLLTVKENAWSRDMQLASEALGDEEEEAAGGNAKLSKSELFSLMFILLSVALWYFGYNAVTSKYSVYATNILDLDYSATLLIANAAAVVSYLPVGLIASKVGRKKTILAGIIMLAVAFTVACFVRVGTPAIVMNLMFALAGIGWATINVNSFPMVVELSKNGDIGKFTGYYYAASMGAQALTPFCSGLLMDKLGMTVLFPYAAVFVSLAFITMSVVKHGDSKPVPKKSALEAFDVDD